MFTTRMKFLQLMDADPLGALKSYGLTQLKLVAALMSPAPLYFGQAG